MSSIYSLILALCITFFVQDVTSQDLTAEVSNATLPRKLSYVSSIYDGKDDIYLIGGLGTSGLGGIRKEILKFSLKDDTITQVGELPIGRYVGGAVIDDQGENIYYFGGYDSVYPKAEIFKFNLATRAVTNVGQLSTPTYAHSAIKYTKSTTQVFLIGGYQANNLVQCWDLNLERDFPTETIDTRFFGSTAVVYKNEAFVFGKTNSTTDKNPIYKINLDTFETSFGESNLPNFAYYPNAVVVGSNAYIIGGWENQADFPANTIIKVDLVTLDTTAIPVVNFIPENSFIFGVSLVYVEKLNRIYVLGGSPDLQGDHDVWYIDLSPISEPPTTTESTSTIDPSLFTCDDKADGFYPNPFDCAQFIGCHDNGTTEYYTCPVPLLYNPVKATCDFASEVNCEISCADKPNGLYPHPQDCSLFIGCQDSTLNVFRCPQPLLFDPVEAKCNFADTVEC